MDLFMDPPPATTNEPLPPLLPPAEPPVYMAHAANPTPPLAHNNHNHPPYAEMITEAITALKERNGSSRQAIAKYIEKNYSGLPSNHSALLTHQLRRLKNNGLLLMVKHSYKLPRSVPLSLPSVPTATTVTGNGNGSASGPKRGRGRPRKLTVDAPPNNVVVGSESMLVSLGLADGPAPVSPEGAELGGPVGIRRGPGRPPRPKSFLPVLMSHSELVGADLGGPVVSKRGRGRPPKKLQSLPGLMGQSGPKRRPGRPPRSIGSGRPRGRPRKDASVVNPLGRKRGRKPKNAAAAVLGGGGEEGFGAVAGGVLPVKRRGRLPRAGGGVKKPRKLTGRPLGRPRKDASISGIRVAATQQLVAYEDLKGKLEFFKSRIQQAVVTVKPHLNPETAMSAFGALQELEELVTMDLNAPLNVQVHIQVQEPLIHN